MSVFNEELRSKRTCVDHPEREVVMYYRGKGLCDECKKRKLGLMDIEIPEGTQTKLDGCRE